jgi:hypothetical protein
LNASAGCQHPFSQNGAGFFIHRQTVHPLLSQVAQVLQDEFYRGHKMGMELKI